MKKRKIIGVVFSICVFAFFAALPIDVSAVTQYGENCTQINAENKYKPTIVEENNTYIISVKEGSFDVKVTGSDGISHENLNLTGTITKNSPMVVPFGNGTYSMRIVLILNKDDDLCLKNTSNGDNVSDGSASFVFTKRRDVSAGLVPNTNYNRICKAFREGINYNTYFRNSGVSERIFNTYNYKVSSAEDKSFYENYLNYCFEQSVEADYTDDLVINMISNVMNIVNSNHNSTGVVTNFDQTFEDLWNSVSVNNDTSSSDLGSSSTKAITLKCDPFSSQVLPGEEYYTNKSMYRKQTTTQVSSTCTKTCREVVTVKYGPPVASKAGLCFEYKVKIQSKVNCSTQFNGGNMPTMPTVCDPYPVCNSYAGYSDQGGPNDDFDACINKCDGGKYTQSCIDKCYKKVYGSSKESTSMLSYQASPKIQKLSDSCIATARTAEDVYNCKKTYPGGHYVRTNEGIIWQPYTNIAAFSYASSNLNNLAIYYFSTPQLTERTLAGLSGQGWTGEINGVYVNDSTQSMLPYYISNGFKIGKNCSETCEWKGCEDTNANPNRQEALREYNEQLQNYINSRNNCTAQASCETRTSEFKMSVKNKYYDNSTKRIETKTIDFPLSGYNTNQTTNGNISFTDVTDNTCRFNPDGRSVIIDQGGQCYGCSNSQYDYMTEISFPGTWRNNKTGEISYTPKNNITWVEDKNKFCTPETSLDVNTKWFEWKFNNTCYTRDEVSRSIQYNIFSELYNFGYMQWYFKVNCFYALKASSGNISGDSCPPPPVTDDCDPTSEKCDDGHIDDYKFRNVKLSNLFPENGSASSYSNTGRTPGFNWSANATNLNNANYEITPTALIKAVQERENEIYSSSNESKYLDYEFVLDKTAINKIRRYNKNKKYTDYGGTVKVVNGVKVYSSNLFRNNNKIINANKTGVLGCNNQSGSGNRCETFTDDYINTLRGGVR